MPEIQMLGLLEHDVVSAISIPPLEDLSNASPVASGSHWYHGDVGSREARKAARDQFDADIFASKKNPVPNRFSIASSAGGTSSGTTTMANSIIRNPEAPDMLRRISNSSAASASTVRVPLSRDIHTISERRESVDHGESKPAPDTSSSSRSPTSTAASIARPSSPSQSSIRSTSTANSSKSPSRRRAATRSQTASGVSFPFVAGFLRNPFRAAPSEPQASQVSIIRHDKDVDRAKAMPISASPRPTSSIRKGLAPAVTKTPLPTPIEIRSGVSSVAIKNRSKVEEESAIQHGSLRASQTRASPLSSSPHDEAILANRRRSVFPLINPSRPASNIPHSQASLARRWQHTFPRPVFQHLVKWKSICTPACLPLTIEYFPPKMELESSYHVYEYDILVGEDMGTSFMLRKPNEKASETWALLIMREMAALRLAQGFQFVVAPYEQESKQEVMDTSVQLRWLINASGGSKPFSRFPVGASDVLKTTTHPVYLSMSNQIHQLTYDAVEGIIGVKRYVRRTTHPTEPYQYTCLVWPKLGEGYTEVSTSFSFPSLELYGWNRMDMLIAGYEQNFSDSLRYWRTRYLVIPSLTPPPPMRAPSGERHSDEEVRLFGIDKLAELFGKARWLPPDQQKTDIPIPPPRFLPTTLEPSDCVLDNTLVAQLEEVHEAGPLRKKRADKNIEDMQLPAIANAMRDPDCGVAFKDNKWHRRTYPDSFTGYDFVSWLVREFRDVSTREQGIEWGAKLLDHGLFEHCRGHHGFLDGHYFYRLKGDFASLYGQAWFRTTTQDPPVSSSKNQRKRLVLSQTMIIDVDAGVKPSKRSDRAQTVILHHDLIHNPAIAFHFELNWIGTTARCIDDTLQKWGTTIERYGLKLVEAYVDQIIDIRNQNIFQCTFPIPLALAPPPRSTPDQDPQYYETAILKHFGFILDIEAFNRYADRVDVFYSYRRSTFNHSQFVHKTGLAFVQIIGEKEGFRWLTNRLFVASNSRTGQQTKASVTADELRVQLYEFCQDADRLATFYEDAALMLNRKGDELIVG